MRSKYLAFGLMGLLACGFSLPEFTEFYDGYVQEIAVKLGAPVIPSHDLIDPEANAVALFNEQHFTLWLSPISSEQSDLPTYYKTILAFTKNHNIKKIIWYFGYTNASTAFYDPTSTDPTSFVKLLTNPSTTFPSTTQIELRLECASMSPSLIYTGSNPPPTVPTYSVLPNYMTSSNGCFYNCLWWARDLYNVVKLTYPSLISGVTVDPQNNCTVMPGPAPQPPDYRPYTVNADSTSAAINAEQAIVNYLDEFASINSDFYPLKRGMTFDGSARKQIFGNRATLPITDAALIGDTSLVYDTSNGLNMYFYNGSDSNRTAPWTRPDPSGPFLDYIYPQLYNLDAPYVFTLQNQSLPAGVKFLQLLSNSPYCPGLTTGGALSTITYTEGSKIISGSGTQFETELNSSGLNSSSPLAVITPSGGQQCLIPSSDPGTACAAKISLDVGVISNVELSLGANVAIPTVSSYLPWLYVENEINYLGYALTPEMVSGIFLMFSAEGNTDEAFFGYWSLSQFMSFINSFYTQGQTSYSPYRGNSGSISVPNQFAIFTYEQITGKAGVPPAIVWFPGE